MKLYFIALIPPKELERDIHALKEEIAGKYNSRKALKLPAHITLEPPFKLREEEEHKIFSTLEKFAEKQEGFVVKLKNFGAFAPRTIFLNVENPEVVSTVFHSLQEELQNSNVINNCKREKSFHPHMTIAFRDLTKEAFQKAWPEYENRKFNSSFIAEGIFLLKHNGKTWDIRKELSFGKKSYFRHQ